MYTLPLPPVVTSYETLVQFHNQYIHIDTVKIQNISVLFF